MGGGIAKCVWEKMGSIRQWTSKEKINFEIRVSHRTDINPCGRKGISLEKGKPKKRVGKRILRVVTNQGEYRERAPSSTLTRENQDEESAIQV